MPPSFLVSTLRSIIIIIIILVLCRLPGLIDELIERLGDGLVPLSGGVLANHGGPGAGMADPGHDLFEGRSCLRTRCFPCTAGRAVEMLPLP